MSLAKLLPSSCLVSLRPCPIAYQAVLQNNGGCFEVRSSAGNLPGQLFSCYFPADPEDSCSCDVCGVFVYVDCLVSVRDHVTVS